MKTTYEPSVIIEEMKNLISYSCQSETISSSKFNTFHSALIKKHFGALEVDIDSKNQEIHLKISVGPAQYTTVKVEFKSLEGFLKSCLKNDAGNLSFYQNMLTFYNVTAA